MFDVIIPIYRISQSFLTRCLESVFDQSIDDTTFMFVMEYLSNIKIMMQNT